MLNPQVSIIIPTYKDWSRLQLCINALEKQTYDNASTEIIIVNNDPSDQPPKDYHLPANMRIISEAKPGSYAARNAALKIAKGEIIGFTDSDCIPDADWIKNAVIHFQNNVECKRIGGRVKLFYKEQKPNLAEMYEMVYAFRQESVVKREGTSVTANMLTYKALFNDIGLFNDSLMSGGDYEWGKRAFKAGYNINYADNVIVNHPARSEVKELTKKAKRISGISKITANNRSKVQVLWDFVKMLRPPVKDIGRINKEDLNLSGKVQVFGLHYYLRVLTATESFRLQLGKTANRE
ncbi:glycosyltransferase [Mucilaginibacter lappiensis]|uniref:glycosyltransferase n=1 Tax=Mucilaginibacter lappiensis TaxID=354630 RepID=UPI003D21CF72